MTQRLLVLAVLPLAVASRVSAQLPSRSTVPPDSLALVLGAPTVIGPTVPHTTDPGAAYEIGPEDVLDISVWKSPELSRTVPVRPDGKVSLPLLNDIQAAGLTPVDLREEIVARLADFVPSPEVSVIVREVHSRKVAVVGAVKTAGRYELKGPMTVLEVIALAQGFTDFATRDRIVVLRQSNGTTTRIPFNYRKLSDGAEQENFYVQPGDIIVVP
jgi:polysaccharide export outer membrane protein